MAIDPANYEAWYHTPRGQWIGEREASLLLSMMRPRKGQTLLDVGSGTGYFSRRFAQAGLQVTGIDPDPAMIDYARRQSEDIEYRQAGAEALPFAEEGFDYCAAITSLCFVHDPVAALQKMWRVSKVGIVLGLLNRHSLLHRQKAGRGAYAGARWDTRADVIDWLRQAGITPRRVSQRSAIFFPSGRRVARLVECVLPSRLPWGGFLAVYLAKPDTQS